MSNWEIRERRVQFFENTLQLCERDAQLIQGVKRTRENTVLWRQPTEEISKDVDRCELFCRVKVTNGNILEEVVALKKEFPNHRMGVLNITSPMHLGGSVIRGGNGQEEMLCRCTTLYPCLNTDYLRKEYYKKNQMCDNGVYSDMCIYTPDIICFREDLREEAKHCDMWERKDWFSVDVISCTLPDFNGLSINSNGREWFQKNVMIAEELESVLKKRLEGVLKVAIEKKLDVLVLEDSVSNWLK